MGLPPFKAYLFDLDGTLLDSAPDICGAVLSVLANTSRPNVPHDYLKTFIGRHLTDLFTDLFPEATPAQVDSWIAEYRQIYPARGHRETKLYPGAADAIARLNGLKGTATTKSTQTAATILAQFGLAPHFHHIQGTDGFPSKPEPDVILRALAALQVDPKDCLFIGDSVPDMLAGHAARVNVCAVTWGYGNPQDLLVHRPHYCLDNLDDL
jgi:HAD superfamily hydrolase (TIGR01549 family)